VIFGSVESVLRGTARAVCHSREGGNPRLGDRNAGDGFPPARE
jgi:hypothetical protein